MYEVVAAKVVFILYHNYSQETFYIFITFTLFMFFHALALKAQFDKHLGLQLPQHLVKWPFILILCCQVSQEWW